MTYEPTADTMLVELRPWPGGDPAASSAGGEDTGDRLIVHHAPDGRPWAWEIEGASRRPDLVAGALAATRADRSRTLAILERAGRDNPPLPGDEPD